MKPILCLDFDGVCHSYTSGWEGAAKTSDPPVDGMWEFLEEALKVFQVEIYSSRSSMPGGRQAMFDWFIEHAQTEEQFKTAYLIKFPVEKPPALVTIDDRAICFDGTWPDVKELRSFRPWNKEQEKQST